MRVLFATLHTHLPQGTGGLEVNTDALCKALLTFGTDARVYCAFDDAKLHNKVRRAARKLTGGTLLKDTVCLYPVYRAKYPVHSAAEVAAVTKPDVVVVQGWDAHQLAKPFVRMGIPTLIYCHNVQRFTYDEELYRTDRLFLAVNSRFTASLHPDKVLRIIPPLIEPDAFRVESTRQTVLFINPIFKKGLAVALELARSRPDVPFDFFEAWTLTAEERKEARRLTAGLGNVRWRAMVSDMRQAYGTAKLVLFPSAMETWGRVASEGHISGIPTLGSDRGALPDTIGPAGLCVPFEAPIETWLGAFCELWDDEIRYSRYAESAKNFAKRDELRVDTVITEFNDLLHFILARHKDLIGVSREAGADPVSLTFADPT